MILTVKLFISLVMQKSQIGGSEKNLRIAQISWHCENWGLFVLVKAIKAITH
jgi:hypothetical protein